MIRRMWSVFVQTLALNFLLVCAAVGWMYQSGRLDRARAVAIKDVLFPKPPPATPAAAGPTSQPTTQPLLRLDALLARHAGKRAGEQVEVVQQSFDSQTAVLDRRRRELDDLQAQLAREKEQLARDAAAVDADRKAVAGQAQQAQQGAADQGFEDTLKLYSTMPARQAKTAFMTLPEDAAARYLRAMPPRTATKIIKEFKTADEQARVNRILERMRQGQSPGQPATQPALAGDGGGGTELK